MFAIIRKSYVQIRVEKRYKSFDEPPFPGVLMLNAVLTVKQSCANSHKGKGWELFTDAVIKAVSDRNKGVVFLLWGKDAQKKASVVSKVIDYIVDTIPSI